MGLQLELSCSLLNGMEWPEVGYKTVARVYFVIHFILITFLYTLLYLDVILSG